MVTLRTFSSTFKFVKDDYSNIRARPTMWIDCKHICKLGKTYCKTTITIMTMMPTFEIISDKYNIGFAIK
jgi:hypothetical protein